MTDIIERLRIESRREPHEPIWRDAIDEIEALRAERDAMLDALREALKLCSAELFAQCADQPRAMQYVEQARAAIAKATGGQR